MPREVRVKCPTGGEFTATVPDSDITVAELKQLVADQNKETFEAAGLCLVCHGQVLADSAPVSTTALFGEANGLVVAVGKKRKADAAAVPPQAAAAAPPPACGTRTVLLVRHGQCANNDGKDDQLRHLTQAGQRQAAISAEYITGLFDKGALPTRRLLVHSTSRRATQTAQHLRDRLGKGLIVLGNDYIRECDPSKNPRGAEAAFQRMFRPPEGPEDETLVIVAHNNTNLYLLLRAASLPPEFAQQVWNMFTLRHASISSVTIHGSGQMEINHVGAGGHFPHDVVTWNNLPGPDTGVISRHKMSGRAMILIPCPQADNDAAPPGTAVQLTRRGNRQAAAAAQYVSGLMQYCVSSRVSLMCSSHPAAMQTGERFYMSLGIQQPIPDTRLDECNSAEELERAEDNYLRLFQAPDESSRDTVMVVGHPKMFSYWIFRALRSDPGQRSFELTRFRLRQGSITILIVGDRKPKVLALGDVAHLQPRDVTLEHLPGADDAPEEPAAPPETIESLELQKRQAFEKKDFAACKKIQERIVALKAGQ
eukprot:TRINITY_DN15964_c0_g1_i1.p1 TRINITY_DN15964_c0_g1~~TRINITY_DN15964_c0_g1_i1.p1  ORF type:complete len:554 (+),score=148.32 TRINITY_DN15964_c0_g1_i1:51-1664(+)